VGSLRRQRTKTFVMKESCDVPDMKYLHIHKKNTLTYRPFRSPLRRPENCVHVSGCTVGQTRRVKRYWVKNYAWLCGCFSWFRSSRSHWYNNRLFATSSERPYATQTNCTTAERIKTKSSCRKITQRSQQKTKYYKFSSHFSMRIQCLSTSRLYNSFILIAWVA
jgi:hypothetical protein